MKKILPWVSVNNTIVSQEDANLSVLDDGFQYGYGFFTTLKVRESIPLFLERHIDRLVKSGHKLAIGVQDFASIKKLVSDIIKKNKIADGGIRITITNGIVGIPTITIHGTTIDTEIHTVPVITVLDTRDMYKTIKMTYRVPHKIAMQTAQAQGSQDALFMQENAIIESTYANVYSLCEDNQIITPFIEGKGLAGISRQILMEKLPIKEQEIAEDTQNPMVLVSSLSISVVEEINGKVLRKDPAFVFAIQNAMDTAEQDYIATHS